MGGSSKRKGKGQPKNAYWIFMMEFQSEYIETHGLSYVTPSDKTEIGRLAGEKWQTMSKEDRAPYEQKAAEGKDTSVKYNSFGMPIHEHIALLQEKENLRLAIEKDIQQTISNCMAFGKKDLTQKLFYLLHFNCFVRTDSGAVIPAEVGLAEFSLDGGIMRTYHALLSTRKIPIGYAFKAKEIANRTHKIPLPSPDPEPSCPYMEKDASKIFRYIQSFLLGKTIDDKEDKDEDLDIFDLPPMYTLGSEMDIINSCMYSVIKDAKIENPKPIQIYPIENLFYEIHIHSNKYRNSMDQTSKANSFTCLFHAQTQFNGDYYGHAQEMACDFHEKEDNRINCSLSKIKSWGFRICEFSLHLLGIHAQAGHHCPVQKPIHFPMYVPRTKEPQKVEADRRRQDRHVVADLETRKHAAAAGRDCTEAQEMDENDTVSTTSTIRSSTRASVSMAQLEREWVPISSNRGPVRSHATFLHPSSGLRMNSPGLDYVFMFDGDVPERPISTSGVARFEEPLFYHGTTPVTFENPNTDYTSNYSSDADENTEEGDELSLSCENQAAFSMAASYEYQEGVRGGTAANDTVYALQQDRRSQCARPGMQGHSIARMCDDPPIRPVAQGVLSEPMSEARYVPGHPAQGPSHAQVGFPAQGPSHAQVGFPAQGPSHAQVGFPAQGSSHAQVGFPAQGSSHAQVGFPAQGPSHAQVGFPAQGSSHAQVGFPAQGPSRAQVGFPAQGPSHAQVGFPAQGSSHAQVGFPAQGPSRAQVGFPAQGPSHAQVGFPAQGPSHAQAGFPAQGPSRAQIGFPPQGSSHAQVGFPAQGTSHAQAGLLRQVLANQAQAELHFQDPRNLRNNCEGLPEAQNAVPRVRGCNGQFNRDGDTRQRFDLRREPQHIPRELAVDEDTLMQRCRQFHI